MSTTPATEIELGTLLACISPEQDHEESDWGTSIGAEQWWCNQTESLQKASPKPENH
jgi:hypothetical protein